MAKRARPKTKASQRSRQERVPSVRATPSAGSQPPLYPVPAVTVDRAGRSTPPPGPAGRSGEVSARFQGVDYSYVTRDLFRIGLLAGLFLGGMGLLAFVIK